MVLKPFLNPRSCPETDRVPSGAIARDTLEKRVATDTANDNELAARPLTNHKLHLHTEIKY